MHWVLLFPSDLERQKEFRASGNVVPRLMWLSLGQLQCFGGYRKKIKDLNENEELCAEP